MSRDAFLVEAAQSVGLTGIAHTVAPLKLPLIIFQAPTSTPVPNGAPMRAENTVVALSSLAETRTTARENLTRLLGALEQAFQSSTEYAGYRLSFFEIQSLPVEQASAGGTGAQKGTFQFNALVRMVLEH